MHLFGQDFDLFFEVRLHTETANSLRNSGFRNLFCLCKSCSFALIFLRDFDTTDSQLKVKSS